jgi:hypothetical protein
VQPTADCPVRFAGQLPLPDFKEGKKHAIGGIAGWS